MAYQSPSRTPGEKVGTNAHHTLAAYQVVLLVETDVARGLARAEAGRRLERFGRNVLPDVAGRGPVVRLARQFAHSLLYVLLAAGAVTMALGEKVDAAVIFGVVLVNAVVGFVQETRAQSALDALKAMVRTRAQVRRDGGVVTVLSDELVPGDVVLVGAGDKVPADARLVELAELEVDESVLTGESVPVVKDEVALLAMATPVADRRNMVYSGTLVTHGTGVGVVVATGAETEVGEIHRLVGSADELETPLSRKLAHLSRVLTVAILGLAGVTFVVGMVRGESASSMFGASVALAVGAIPEGLPAAVTITLAIGVSRMARRGAVVRRMPAVEALGSVTVVCSDKTGTLTENQMTVRAIWTPEGTYEVTGSGYRPEGEIRGARGEPVGRAGDTMDEALRWTLVAGAACNDAQLREEAGRWEVVGDPTEGAMVVAAAKGGIEAGSLLERLDRVATVPFSSERRFMATLHDDTQAGGEGRRIVLAKGAVEAVVDLCRGQMGSDGTVAELDRAEVLAAADRLARSGLRVLATAMGTVGPGELMPEDLGGGLTLAGLQAMLDPPRPAAKAAVGACHDAGIDVKMITGDHATTATVIAEQLGILGGVRDGEVLTGEELARLDRDSLPAALSRASVFARVSAVQKLRLVEGLQAGGAVVAMTGDGVNDAPALKQADIGVSMGKVGSEVAKEAADMILTDDDFATIEAAVEEGRGVFDNLTKFMEWTLPTNIGEGLVILVAIFAGATLPIVPVQILWINMTTAVALGLMLAFEPKEPGIMGRPPRDPSRPILTGALAFRTALVSALLVAGSLWLFHWEQSIGASIPEARTAALNLFVVVEAFHLFGCRSLTRSVFAVGVFSNRWILGGVAVQALAQLAITYLPAMNRVFGTAPIGVGSWLRVFGLGAAASAVVALDKRLRRAP